MSFTTILLQAATGVTGTTGTTGVTGGTGPVNSPGGLSGMSNFLFIGLLIIVFYFFMIKPQQRKQKEAAALMGEIGKGSKIITMGGIHGKIIEVRDKSFVIEVEGGNRLQIMKSAVSVEYTKTLNTDLSTGTDDKKA
jgi:preprotein translocase subunit YajC